jgi:pimeloyl-ACP methyl ester carboxylesterase
VSVAWSPPTPRATARTDLPSPLPPRRRVATSPRRHVATSPPCDPTRCWPDTDSPGSRPRAIATSPQAQQYALEVNAHRSNQETVEILASLLTSASRPEPAYRLPVPALLVHGAQDRVGDIAAEMGAWSQREPLAVIPNAAHISNLDNPVAFNALTTAFLDELLHPEHTAATSGSTRSAEKLHRHS